MRTTLAAVNKALAAAGLRRNTTRSLGTSKLHTSTASAVFLSSRIIAKTIHNGLKTT